MGLSSAQFTDFFEDAGEYIELAVAIREAANGDASAGLDIPALRDEIVTELTGNNTENVLSGTDEDIDAIKDAMVGFVETVAARVERRLLDRTTVIDNLPVPGDADTQTVLAELIRDMNDSSESIDASTVTVGSVSADGGNNGDGNFATSKVLDGASSPAEGVLPNLEYKGVDSELSVTSETVTLTCVQDEDTDGVPEGEEVFEARGGIPDTSRLGWRGNGSGQGPQVPTLNASQLVLNKDFETWDANVPVNWDLDNGTAGTHVIQESTAADVFRGDSSLKISGDGAQATIGISQDVDPSTLTPNQRYALSCQVKGTGSTASGQLDIYFNGTGYTASSSEKITLDATALSAQTSFGHEYFFINLPATLPDDWELVIEVTGTLTNAKDIWIDSLAFGPVSWFGGVNFFAYAGATQFARGDRFSFTLANDQAGTFQRFFGEFFRVQLPSDTGGSETQADSLAE